MAAAAIITVIYGLAVVVDYVPIIKAGRKKELWLYGAILTVSYGLFLNSAFLQKPLSPWQPILELIRTVFHLQ